MAADNPWGLTAREAQVMDALVVVGSQKAAARELHLSLKTVESHCARVSERMGLKFAGSSARKLVLWDRWRRDGRTDDDHLKAKDSTS